MSLALPFAVEKNAALVLISSLSLLEAVKEFDQNAGVKLKWPNDVLLNGGKISGILLEKGAGGYMIVGIGVNLRASPAGETVYPVTDLAAAGIKTDCRTFKEVYLRRFDALTDLWEQKGMPALTERWRRHARGLGAGCGAAAENDENRNLRRHERRRNADFANAVRPGGHRGRRRVF